MNRRGFLHLLGLSAVGLAVVPVLPEAPVRGILRRGEMTFPIRYEEPSAWVCSGFPQVSEERAE